MGLAIRPFQGFLLRSVAPYNLRGISIFKKIFNVHWGNGYRPRKHAHSLTRWLNHGGLVNSTLLVDYPNAPPNLPARRNLNGEPPYTDSRAVRTGPSQLVPIRPKARKSEKGSRG